jgi:hypothetical protein
VNRFDATAWTRRRFGFAALALAALFGHDSARGKKKCKRVTRPCDRKGDCCGNLVCRPVNGFRGDRCCRRLGDPCSGLYDCCGIYFCAPSGQCEIPDSDRNLKENFASVDPVDILARVRSLSIATQDDPSTAAATGHVGPLPIDFGATFGVGDDRFIHPIDGQGVTLAAIQGLSELIEGLHADNETLRARIERLER